MLRGMKIRLKPTPEQEVLFRKSSGVARFAYNWGLARAKQLWDEEKIKFSSSNLNTEFVKHRDEYPWISEVSAKVATQAFRDLENAMVRFYKNISRYPRFKTKKRNRPSFYVRNDQGIKFKNGCVRFEKIGWVKYSTNYKIPAGKKCKTRCVFDGKYWYFCFSYECEKQAQETKIDSIGIDLGINKMATISTKDGATKEYGNINYSKEVKRLKKKIRRISKQISRKYKMYNRRNGLNKGERWKKSNNIIKLEKKLVLLYRRLTNIRHNYIHQTTASIIKMKPQRIVMEKLNIRGMLKNKHRAFYIQDLAWFEFIRQMKYKSEQYDIDFVQADMWFPSTKTCSRCGVKIKYLPSGKRTFHCDNCDLIIDRDINAAINLANYS